MITRGGKVAAEKCGREIESGLDMGSPDRRESIPSPDDNQDSPLFKYLCNLSPIKPAKSVHHAQTYNEMTFPPEPRIFASPRSARRNSASSLKRVLMAERVTAQAQAEGREPLGWHRTSVSSTCSLTSDVIASPPNNHPDRVHQGVASCSGAHAEDLPAQPSNNVKTESLCNDVYLAENLAGQGMFAVSSTHLVPEKPSCEINRTAVSTGSFQTQYTDFEQLDPVLSAAEPMKSVRCMNSAQGKLGVGKDGQTGAADQRQSLSTLMPQVVDSVLAGNLSQESKCRDHEHHRSLSMASSSHNEDHGLNFNIKCEGEAELDQDTTAMAYFLAGDADLGQDNGEDNWSEDSGEVVVSRLPLRCSSVYSENQSDRVVEENIKQENTVITSQSGLDSSSEDREDVAAVLTTEDVSQLTYRVDSVGQRGFRRRCLDFDASGARRKSLGSMGNRKSLGSRLKDSGGSCTIADGPQSVLTDIGTASSSGMQVPAHDISNTNTNESLRAESMSASVRGGSSCDGNAGAMATMQLTVTKNMDCLPMRGGDASVRRAQNSNNNQGGAQMFNPSEKRGRSPPIRPSGIGLHLNSLTTSSMSFKREFQSSGLESSKGVLATVLGIQPLATTNPKEDPAGEGYEKIGLGNGGLSAMLNQNFSPNMASLLERRNQMEKDTAETGSISSKRVKIPNADFRTLHVESLPPLEESLLVSARGTGMLKCESPIGHKRSHQELMRQPEGEPADDLLESPQSLKRRRRKSIPPSGDKSAEGCKRCNCKKSKCLKLYCECFAAGVYCVGSCACKDCFNKPEYEETVLNTRQQIESRNPLAFAPKIVQGAESSPIPGDEALDTPASARHKRGCNCKKSLCLKKYCECYQAGVGCSEGCRCEGCKNMFGRKEGPEEGEEKEGEQANSAREESQTEDPIELLNRMSGKSDRLRESAKQNLSPITPTFDYDGLGRSMLRLRSTGRKRAASDEHCASPLPQRGSRPSKSPTRFSHTLDAFHPVSYPHNETDFSMSGGGDSPMTTPTFARIGHLSPRWDGLQDICTLTPLPLAPLRPTPGSAMGTLERPGRLTESGYHGASSTSGHHHMSTRGSSPRRFRQPAPRSPLRYDTPHQSQQLNNDLNQLTPSLQSSPLAGKNLESELESVKAGADDDDTPDFIKYGDEMGSPTRTTVTSSGSPKQKRVTPPRYGGNREQGSSRIGCGNSLSPGLRNSRKFILQALPSLPPVTPPFSNG